MQTVTSRMQSANSSEHAPMAKQKNLTNSKISQVHVGANVENDRLIQKVINLVENKNAAVIARLPPPVEGKIFTPFRSTQMAFNIWITASLSRGTCVKTVSVQFNSATRGGTLC